MRIRTAQLALICAAFMLLVLAGSCNKGPQESADTGTPATGSSASGSRSDESPAEAADPDKLVADAVKPPSESTRPLLIWTDPALATVLQSLSEKFKAQYAPSYTLAFVDKGDLLRTLASISDGSAPQVPDVYVYTGQEIHSALVNAKAIDEATARTFAGDRLVLACRSEDGYTAQTVFDISKLRFKSCGVADPAECMLGIYTDQAMISDGLKDRISDRLSTLASGDELVNGLNDKSLDVAFIYASQAAQSRTLKAAVLVDEGLHEDVQYKAAAASGRGADKAVMDLLTFLAEDAGIQADLESYGFTSRATAIVEDK